MDYLDLRSALGAYTGPVLCMRPESESIYQVPAVLDANHCVYAIDIESDTGGVRFRSQDGRVLKMSEVQAYDRDTPGTYTSSRMMDFENLGKLAGQVRESFPELSPAQRTDCCERLCNMWQAATMMQGEAEQSFRIGSAFENMMARVGPMQESFLNYVQSGCAIHSDYFGFETGSDMQARRAEFEKATESAIYKFMDVYGQTTAPTQNKQVANAFAYGAQWGLGEPPQNDPKLVLPESEQRALSDFSKELAATSDERAKFENAFGYANMTGVKFKDFNITMPYGMDLTAGDMALNENMPGVGEFETVELRDSCGRDFRDVAKRLGYHARTPRSELLNEMDEYGGPILITDQGPDFLHNEIKGLHTRGYHTSREMVFMLNPNAGDSERNMIGPYGESCTEHRVVPVDRDEMEDDDIEARVNEFKSLRHYALAAKDAMQNGRMSPAESREVCELISSMWQGATLSKLGVNDGHGRDFDNVQARVPAFREGFLDYVAAGAAAYQAYYDPFTSDATAKEYFNQYGAIAVQQAAEVAQMWDAPFGLSSQEELAMAGFAERLNERAHDERGVFAIGLRLSDFDVPTPHDIYIPQVHEDVANLIRTDKISAVRMRAETAMQFGGSDGLDSGIESKSSGEVSEDKPRSSVRDMRDLESAADDIESKEGNHTTRNCAFD